MRLVVSAILLTLLFIEVRAMDLVTIEKLRAQGDTSILTSKAEEVKFPLSEDVQNNIKLLEEAATKYSGVGLAAVQIGLKQHMFIIEITQQSLGYRDKNLYGETGLYPVARQIYFNASYQGFNEEKIEDFEGCFSVADHYAIVPRYRSIKFLAQDRYGNKIERIVSGFEARVLQHEIDHLEGMLIIDRAEENKIFKREAPIASE